MERCQTMAHLEARFRTGASPEGRPRATAGGRPQPATPSRIAASGRRCRPSASKLAGASHAAKPRFTRGHSVSSMAYHAVSRLRPLTDHVLAEHALEGKAEPECRGPGRRVQRVAFPLVATVTEVVEDVASQQRHGFGCTGLPLQSRGEQNIADFDDAMDRLDPHQRRVALCLPRSPVDDGPEQRIVGGGLAGEVGREAGLVRGRSIKQVVPDLVGTLHVTPQCRRVSRGIERLQPDEMTIKHDALGSPHRPGLDRGAYRALAMRDLQINTSVNRW